MYGTTGVLQYLLSLTPKNDLNASFEAIASHEQKLVEPLLTFLTAPEQVQRGVRIFGEETAGINRVPTVSFLVVGERAIKSSDIVEVFDKKGEVSSKQIANQHPSEAYFVTTDWYSVWT